MYSSLTCVITLTTLIFLAKLSFSQEALPLGNNVLMTEDYLIIGDPNYSDRKNTRSSVIIFDKKNNDWILKHNIHSASDENSNLYGESIAINGNDLFVANPSGRKIVQYKMVNDQIRFFDEIHADPRGNVLTFGNNIRTNKNQLIISSLNKVANGAITRGLVNIYTFMDGKWVSTQKLFALGNDRWGFGSNLSTAGDYLFIGSNAGRVQNETGKVYIYHNQNNIWNEIQVLENKKSKKGDTFGHEIASFKSRLAVAKSDYEYNKSDSNFVGTGINLYKLSKEKNQFRLDTTLVSPDELQLKSFGNRIVMNSDKIYVGAIAQNNENIVLVYNLNCNFNWELKQVIKPETNSISDFPNFNLSLDCNENMLVIGTTRSNYKTYHDATVLQKGKAILYEYDLDTTLISHIKVIKENSYVSPSGKPHYFSKIFKDTILNKQGCDSIINIDLTILYKYDEETPLFETVTLSPPIDIQIDERPVQVAKNLEAKTELVHVHLYDYADYDHDSISVQLNGEWILNEFEINNNKKSIHVLLHKGKNTFIIHAINEGDRSPNTARIKVVDANGLKLGEFTLRSTLKESSSFTIDY